MASVRLLEQTDREYIERAFAEPLKTVMLNTTFFVGCRCGLHACGCGLRWSNWGLLPLEAEASKGFLRAVHVGLGAHRKGFSILAIGLTTFLGMVVWRDSADHPPDVEKLWSALGYPQEIAAQLRALNPRVEGNDVVFNNSYRQDKPDVMQRLSFLVLTIWRFGDFSDTRFAGQGRPLRAYTASNLIGTDLLISKLIAGGCGTYHIGGAVRMAPAHREFAAIQCLASKVTEDLVHELLKDDRVARCPDKYKAALSNSMQELDGAPDYVWQRLAAVSKTGIGWKDFKTKCITSAWISCAYIDRHIWRYIQLPPWSLCAGSAADIDARLSRFADAPEPEHPMGKSIQWLLRTGWPRSEIVELVTLLGLCHWSSLSVEQAHGSWAVLRRYHPTCFWTTLAMRALCHMLRALLALPKVDPELATLQARLVDLRRKMPERMSGVNILVRDTSLAADVVMADGAAPDRFRLQSQMTADAMRAWPRFPPDTAATYRAQADIEKLEKRRRLDVDIAKNEDAIEQREKDLTRARLSEGCKCSAADTRFDEHALAQLQASYTSGEFMDEAHVEALRRAAEKGPPIPSPDQLLAVMSMPFYAPTRLHVPRPWWVPMVSHFRRQFMYKALRFTSASGQVQWYYYTYAMQNPREVSLLALTEEECDLPVPGLGTGNLASCLWFPLYFKTSLSPMRFLHEFDPAARDVVEIDVVPDVQALGSGYFGARAEPMPFFAFVLDLGDVPKRAYQAAPARDGAGDVNKLRLAEMFPWYAQRLRDRELKRDPTLREKHARRRLARAAELDEETMRWVHEEVDALRQRWLDSHGAEVAAMKNFRVEHRGGLWTAAHVGLPCDTIRGICCSADASKFCRRWDLRQEFGVAITRHGGYRNAEVLAWAWCCRMDHFWMLWRNAGFSADFEFAQADADSVQESEELRTTSLEWPAASWSARKLGELREIAPRGRGRARVAP